MTLLMVDCENCSIESIEDMLCSVIDTQVVFVVGNLQQESKYLMLGLKAESVKSPKCGKNAADFVLVTELTNRLNANKYDRAIIMSNDCGYDTVCEYLNHLGFKVTRHDTTNTIMPRGIGNFCRFISKNFNSGIIRDRIIDYTEGTRDVYSKYIDELNRMHIINMKNNRIYFNKQRLLEISRDNIAQIKYLNELRKR